LGVDIVLDKTEGPLMLELNARPGLNIQIANRRGLLTRYEAIEAEAARQPQTVPVGARVAFSQALDGDAFVSKKSSDAKTLQRERQRRRSASPVT
ncbi:MAG: sugar-transfer associated ATP-grasp domain-containing protein, partial [Legionella sp.]|nr:sugar-transfer associated ATP-grasp domain-containing protein [Legionella sp.]